MSTPSLFPQPQEIDHLGDKLRIETRLSSGFTAEVYRGILRKAEGESLPVAIKVMKALDFPMARRLFYQEGETLSLLMGLEEEFEDPLSGGELKIAPRYYGMAEYQGTPYIVMEFIAGEQILELLKKQGPFPEKEALVTAWHLYRMFHILHTRLGKFFIDLKFENLWWSSDPKNRWGGQLRLTDFGTLEEIKKDPEGVKQDLLLGGVYLFALLTGKILNYGGGRLREPAEPFLRQYAEKMSWGTRRLLAKLLHRNPQMRFGSAEEVLKGLRMLVSFWGGDQPSLIKRIELELQKAEREAERARGERSALSQEGIEAAERALSALDILRIRFPDAYYERDAERAQNVLALGDYLERGLLLLRGHSFTLARQIFEEGFHWAENPAVLRRWFYVAQIGEEIPSGDFEKRFAELESLLGFINKSEPSPEQWSIARRNAEALKQPLGDKPSIDSKGLQHLIAECRFYEILEQAEAKHKEENFEEAARLYGEAEKVLMQLPESIRQMLEEESGSMVYRRWAEEKQTARQRSLEVYHEAEQAIHSADFSQIVPQAERAYQLYRPLTEKDFHPRNIEKLLQEALYQAQGHPEQVEKWLVVVRDLAQLIWHEGVFYPETAPFFFTLSRLSQFQTGVKQFDSSMVADYLRHVASQWKAGTPFIEVLIRFAAEQAISAKQATFLQALAGVTADLLPNSPWPEEWRSRAGEMLHFQDEARHRQIDELLQWTRLLLDLSPFQQAQSVAQFAARFPAFDLLSLDSPQARLEKAETWLKQARILSEKDTYRHQELEELEKRLNEMGSRIALSKKEGQQAQEERRKRLQALSAERQQLAQQLEWLRRAPANVTLDAYYQELYKQIADFLYRCYLAEELEQEDLQHALLTEQYLQEQAPLESSIRVLREWAIRSLNALGGEGWQRIMEQARASAQHSADWAAQAHRLFDEGALSSLAAELDRAEPRWGSTKEWRSLKQDLVRAKAWQAWCEEHCRKSSGEIDKNILNQLASFPELNLPRTYWEKSRAPHYLEELRNYWQGILQDEVTRGFLTSQKLLHAIQALLTVHWIKTLAEQGSKAKQAPAWDGERWLKTAYELARQKNWKGLATFIQQAPLPSDLQKALDALTLERWERIHKEYDQAKAKARKRQRWFWGSVTAGLLILGLFVGGLLVYQRNRPMIQQAIYGTYTPTATLTPTMTLTPTPTLTPTLTPTSTPSPTPIPPSAFLLRELASLFPSIPLAGEAYWVINDDNAIFAAPTAGSTWQEWTLDDKKEKYKYLASGEASVMWEMDVPFDTDGLYGVYVIDPSLNGGGLRQTYQVLLDGQPVQPYRGSNTIWLTTIGQYKQTLWRSIGFYQVQRGQKMSVLANAKTSDKEQFPADRVLIIRLTERERTMLEALPAGRTLVSLLDDSVITLYDVVPGETGKKIEKDPFASIDAKAWNGSFRSRNLGNGYVHSLWVDWAGQDFLPAGEYEVYVWIPPLHATVAGEYRLLLSGKEVERPNPAQVNQGDFPGQWVTLGIWKLDKEGLVGLRLLVEKNTPGEIGIDAVAILSAGP